MVAGYFSSYFLPSRKKKVYDITERTLLLSWMDDMYGTEHMSSISYRKLLSIVSYMHLASFSTSSQMNPLAVQSRISIVNSNSRRRRKADREPAISET